MADQEVAVVVGGGPGLSASLVRLFTREGMKAAIAARNPDKLEALSESTGCRAYRCDAVVPEEVNELFAPGLAGPRSSQRGGLQRQRPRTRSLTEIDAGAVRDAIMVTCYGGFLVGQAAAVSMLRTGGGTILFTGASASVKGIRELRVLRHGQVRAQRSDPEHGAGIPTAEHPRSADRHRRRHRFAPAGPRARPGHVAEPGQHRGDLSASSPPTPERLGIAHRVETLGREVLTRTAGAGRGRTKATKLVLCLTNRFYKSAGLFRRRLRCSSSRGIGH